MPNYLRDDVPAGVLEPPLKLLLVICEDDLRECIDFGVPQSEPMDLFSRLDSFPVLPNICFPNVLFIPFLFFEGIFEFDRCRLIK